MRILSAVVGVTVALLLGCAGDARQRMARFFFEIPDRPASQPADAEPSAPPDQNAPASVEPTYASVHRPFAEQQCSKCHDTARQMRVQDDLPAACRSCHARYFGKDVLHDPVASGSCTTCHEPHRSRYASLLKAGTLQVCTECHDAPARLSAPRRTAARAPSAASIATTPISVRRRF